MRIRIGSGVRIAKSGSTAKNPTIINRPEKRRTGVCGCRTRPISSSFFNST